MVTFDVFLSQSIKMFYHEIVTADDCYDLVVCGNWSEKADFLECLVTFVVVNVGEVRREFETVVIILVYF